MADSLEEFERQAVARARRELMEDLAWAAEERAIRRGRAALTVLPICGIVGLVVTSPEWLPPVWRLLGL